MDLPLFPNLHPSKTVNATHKQDSMNLCNRVAFPFLAVFTQTQTQQTFPARKNVTISVHKFPQYNNFRGAHLVPGVHPIMVNSPISIFGQLTNLHHWSTHPPPSLVNSPISTIVNSPISVVGELTHLPHCSTLPPLPLVNPSISTSGQLTHLHHWSIYPTPSLVNSPIYIIGQLTHFLCWPWCRQRWSVLQWTGDRSNSSQHRRQLCLKTQDHVMISLLNSSALTFHSFF